jgi:TRAP-type C4-dicarboxylate transport system permease small subunit
MRESVTTWSAWVHRLKKAPIPAVGRRILKYVQLVVNGVSALGRNIGAAFLLGVVTIMCANVAYRAIGGIIPGTFDLVEILIIPAVGFALVTVEYQRRHTVVDMVTTHLPAGVRSLLEIAVSIVGLFYWAALCWAGWRMLLRKMATGEATQLLQISVTPFRMVWVFTLAWICIVIVWNLTKMIGEMGEKK